VHHAQRRRRLKLDHAVAVGDGVQAVVADAAEAQLAGHELTVDGVGHTSQGASAQGQDVGPLEAVLEAPDVAVEHLEVGEQVVGEEHGLGPLEVGVAGHDHLAIGLRQVEKRRLQATQGGQHAADGVLQVEAQVGGHLIVAGASGVQAVGSRADLLPQAGLDVHVNVFQLAPELEPAGLDLIAYLRQAAHDGLAVLLGDDALLGQHAGVSDGAGDVVPPQSPVDVDGGGEGLGSRVGGLGEAGSPNLGGLLLSHD